MFLLLVMDTYPSPVYGLTNERHWMCFPSHHTHKHNTHFDYIKYFSKNVAETLVLKSLGELTVLRSLRVTSHPSECLLHVSTPKPEQMLHGT
jgi:hypothetical protein